ncbi:beta-lactamase [Moniliophthora roreri]|uniref:Beta-lactamase-related domain-containing protein n=1 Tax=Moniliophthora roreri TaxID=221103 RepID=A0A0W0EY34_MONRR|nr:beta-lactamase [Moniliophthora roreri]
MSLSLLWFFFLFDLVVCQTVLTSQVDSFINGLLAEWGSPGGISVAVVSPHTDGTWVVETKGYGTAKLSDNSSVTPDTLFPIASNSKHFTVIGTGLLISNESIIPRISWDTPIASIIPTWGLADELASNKSTILDLMSHRTGLPGHDFMCKKNDTLASVTERLKFLKPSVEFRERFQYTNTMYQTLGYLPEFLSTRTTLARYVKENIFVPLGMNSTTYSFDVASQYHLAEGVARENFSVANGLPGTGTPRSVPFYLKEHSDEDGNVMSGPAGIISNANDLAKWLQTLLLWGKHPITNETVIPEEILRKPAEGVTVMDSGLSGLLPPQVQSILSPVVYGGGLRTSTYRGHIIVEHDGYVHGANSDMARLPFENIGVAVMSNDDDIGGNLVDIIKYRLIDEALGLEPFDWNTAYQIQALALADVSSSTSRPENASDPSVSFQSLSGTYNNPGYGNWTFCYLGPFNLSSEPECRDVVANSTVLLAGGINYSIPTMVAKIDAVLVDYVKLQHWSGNSFNPTNDPNHPFWVKEISRSGFQAQFAKDENGNVGLAFNGGFWITDSEVEDPQGSTLEEEAEVWFVRHV